MKKIATLTLILGITFASFSQERTLPEGWDEIILEGKPAYMNSVTGDISTTFPSRTAVKKTEVTEYEPTQTHIVKKGETLSSIARKYNLSLAKIYRLNNVENFDSLSIDQEIVVGYNDDFKEDVNEKYNDVGTDTHIVKSGETLYRISKNYNLSVARLKSLNGLTSNLISIGQELRIK